MDQTAHMTLPLERGITKLLKTKSLTRSGHGIFCALYRNEELGLLASLGIAKRVGMMSRRLLVIVLSSIRLSLRFSRGYATILPSLCYDLPVLRLASP
jgi:hypothetical protein